MNCLYSTLLGAGLAMAGCGGNQVTSPSPIGPSIVEMSPAPGQSFVAANQSFMAEFSEAMNQPSVEAAYKVTVGQTPVAGAYTWDTEGRTMHFQSSSTIAPGAQVEVSWGSGMQSRMGQPLRQQNGQAVTPFSFACTAYATPAQFTSNGQQIYYTATSASGAPVSFTMGTQFDNNALPGYSMMSGGMMGGSMMGRGMMGGTQGAGWRSGGWMGMQGGGHYGMACATCHGPEGKGGLYLMMGAVITPDIRYAVLSAPELDPKTQEVERPAFSEEGIKQAITQGLDSDGKSLNPFMPRWSMADQDLADLLAFLKTL